MRKRAKLTPDAEATADRVVAALAEVGDVSSRKMFGGYGVFESGTMFALVDASGGLFVRGGDANAGLLERAGSVRHGKMPYYAVPDAVQGDPAALVAWAEAAIEVSRTAKKG